MSTLTKQEQKNFSKFFDHTLLKPEAREAQIIQLCQEALQYQIRGSMCKSLLCSISRQATERQCD